MDSKLQELASSTSLPMGLWPFFLIMFVYLTSGPKTLKDKQKKDDDNPSSNCYCVQTFSSDFNFTSSWSVRLVKQDNKTINNKNISGNG